MSISRLIATCACVLVVAATIQTVRAQALVSPSLLDHRIQTLLYTPTQVIRLRGWIGYQLQLLLEEGESVKGVSSGDLDGFTHDHFENHLFIKPHARSLKTNITVVTNKRSYEFEYQVSPNPPDPINDEIVYVVQFNYPKDPLGNDTNQVTRDLAKSSAARFQNMDYWYRGSSLLRPVGASDDGVHTRLRFAPAAELPAIFVRNDDGKESLLNFTVEGRDVVIQRLARSFILRRGSTTGCVTNKGFIGSGERLDSGTISPHVHRQTREIHP